MERWICDTAPSERYRLWSRANAGEVMPEPVSPLTGTLTMFPTAELGWRDAYAETGTAEGDEFEPLPVTNAMGCFGGHLYLNMSLTRLFGVRMPGMTPEMVDFTYFGEMPGIPSYASEARPTDVSPRHSEKIQRWLERVVFGVTSLPELAQDRAHVRRLVEGRPDLAALGDGELVVQLRSFAPAIRHLFKRHIMTSAATGIGIGMVADGAQRVGRPELSLTLIAGLGDVESAAPAEVLFELSRQINASPTLSELFDAGIDDLPARIGTADDPAVAAFRDGCASFGQRFAARGPNEWELRSKTWGTHPELALALIERMRRAPDDQSPAAKRATGAADREAATADVCRGLEGDPAALGQFLAGLQVAQVFNPGRERSKASCILVMHEIRLVARELGRRLVERGAFDTVEQIFMVTDGELDRLVAEPAAFTGVVRQREQEYLALFDLEPPFVFEHQPPPLSQWPRRDAAEVEVAGPGAVLTGIAGCPGQVTGTARVVMHPSDPRELGPGEILVAPITDPAWTPLFVPAAGVVVDVGAQITHAVIVSRELGIPCVVSVTGATRRIPDGATITVDGSTGTVTVVAVPEAVPATP